MLFTKKKNYTRQGKIRQAREIDHTLFCMASATVLVTWRHALVFKAGWNFFLPKGRSWVPNLILKPLQSGRWNWTPWLFFQVRCGAGPGSACCWSISTSTQESKHAHCRQIGVNWWTSPKPLNQLCDCYVLILSTYICNWVTQVTLIIPIHP